VEVRENIARVAKSILRDKKVRIIYNEKESLRDGFGTVG